MHPTVPAERPRPSGAQAVHERHDGDRVALPPDDRQSEPVMRMSPAQVLSEFSHHRITVQEARRPKPRFESRKPCMPSATPAYDLRGHGPWEARPLAAMEQNPPRAAPRRERTRVARGQSTAMRPSRPPPRTPTASGTRLPATEPASRERPAPPSQAIRISLCV